MTIFDRITNTFVHESNLPGIIDLGRFAILQTEGYTDLSGSVFKTSEGQVIRQELLDPVNKDKHEILERISEFVCDGKFKAIPLMQGIKKGLEFGEFELALEKKISYIEAIFHAPHSKLNRTIEKVSVSKAKRISNRSCQYLAAHTEDWLNKNLVSFHPSRILTEEIIIDENVYENQLLIAFVIRASQYLERRLSHTKDITKFLEDYRALMNKRNDKSGWYRRVEREYTLAGSVYDEQGSNYKSGEDIEVVLSTQRRLRKLRDKLLKFRQFDLFYNVDQHKVNTILYHDTNVLISHKHYRYLKELWLKLIKEEYGDKIDNKCEADAAIIHNLRLYGLTIVNYAVHKYLRYEMGGIDTVWLATRQHSVGMRLELKENGIVDLQIGNQLLQFVVLGNLPSSTDSMSVPDNVYIIAYDNSDRDNEDSNSHVIRVSLKDITSVERVAIIIRKTMIRDFLLKTIFQHYCLSQALLPYKYNIEMEMSCVKISDDCQSYIFVKYPCRTYRKDKIFARIQNTDLYKDKNYQEQKKIRDAFDIFFDSYSDAAIIFTETLRCFDSNCLSSISKWQSVCLNYIQCTCGFVLDSTDIHHVRFYKKDEHSSAEEMGMDYLEIDMKCN